MSQGGNTIIPVGARAGETSSGGSDGSCDTTVLFEAILQGALGGLGTCEPAGVPGTGELVSRRRGAVVIDSDGKAIDNTGLSGAEKDAWLETWAAERWICLAGQSIGYKCKAAP